ARARCAPTGISLPWRSRTREGPTWISASWGRTDGGTGPHGAEHQEQAARDQEDRQERQGSEQEEESEPPEHQETSQEPSCGCQADADETSEQPEGQEEHEDGELEERSQDAEHQDEGRRDQGHHPDGDSDQKQKPGDQHQLHHRPKIRFRPRQGSLRPPVQRRTGTNGIDSTPSGPTDGPSSISLRRWRCSEANGVRVSSKPDQKRSKTLFASGSTTSCTRDSGSRLASSWARLMATVSPPSSSISPSLRASSPVQTRPCATAWISS